MNKYNYILYIIFLIYLLTFKLEYNNTYIKKDMLLVRILIFISMIFLVSLIFVLLNGQKMKKIIILN